MSFLNTYSKNTTNISKNDIILNLQDYMFTSKNLNKYTKHIVTNLFFKPNKIETNLEKKQLHVIQRSTTQQKHIKSDKLDKYYPKQTDSLFWCFYILKHGYSNYEMEINNQYFVIEKKEKFKYIDMIRDNKNLLKIHKIKPFTELEDDLANKDKISVKTFFALCILENINILLVNKRKYFELICTDIDVDHPIHIIHRNSQTYEHFIELNNTNELLQKYRDMYYKMESLDDTKLKSIGSYKLEDLTNLCKKLDINISKNEDGKKIKKTDIYQLLVLHY
jgi:hypothetical protein